MGPIILCRIEFSLILSSQIAAILQRNRIRSLGLVPDKSHKTKVALMRKFVSEIKNN